MKSKKTGIIIILLIALATRILLFSGILLKNPDGFFQGDAYCYWQIAENVINHGSFSQSTAQPFIPSHNRTPVYPLFLAFLRYIGLDAKGIVFIQILLSSATCLIVILLTYKLTESWKPAFLAGGILAIDVPSIVLSNCLLSETLFTFLLTLSILYLVLHFKRAKKISTLLFSSVLMGLSILCRPIAVVLPVFIIMCYILFRKMMKSLIFLRIVTYLLFCFFVVSPWLIRNQIVFGSMFLNTIGYIDLLHDCAASVYAVGERMSLSESLELLREKAESTFQGNREKEAIKYIRNEARVGASIIMSYPMIYIKQHILSGFYMISKPMRSTIDLQLGFSQKGTTLTPLTPLGEKDKTCLFSRLLQKTSTFTTILVFVQIFMLITLWISAIYGIGICLAKKEYLSFFIVVSVIVYFCITVGVLEAYARFRVPIVPFLAVAGGIGIAGAYERLREMKR